MIDIKKSAHGPVFDEKTSSLQKIERWTKKHPYTATLAVLVVISILFFLSQINGRPYRGAVEVISLGDKTVNTATHSLSGTQTDAAENTVVVQIQPLDSYTLAVRRGITQYLQENAELQVSRGARLYAETIITQTVQNEPFTIGARLSILEKKMRAVLTEEYATLSQHQKNIWERNAAQVKF